MRLTRLRITVYSSGSSLRFSYQPQTAKSLGLAGNTICVARYICSVAIALAFTIKQATFIFYLHQSFGRRLTYFRFGVACGYAPLFLVGHGTGLYLAVLR